jgi:FixJ family two-component response regulator
VLDDEELVRKSIHRLLRALGFEAEVFSSAKALLTSSRLGEAACLILDVQMPELDGPQVQNRLLKAGYHTPIIVMTARLDENVRTRMLEAGAVGFLHKPFTEQDLADRIRAALKMKEEGSSP